MGGLSIPSVAKAYATLSSSLFCIGFGVIRAGIPPLPACQIHVRQVPHCPTALPVRGVFGVIGGSSISERFPMTVPPASIYAPCPFARIVWLGDRLISAC